ncbi:oxygenase MpaB family protein [Lacihabitans soyangensis]|uniref:DUF2236 domain-containing protein n=1 Tax=Lacihabitans soyangensis TaxID=869394 RepID=A0AAE3KTS5_9BACT|nr:oxygenase MpaB family protein [Lacihabitans soyangensis]MCP9762516.1 DUF2236 domain-containing protein [Lacihabitans soyangensis]
MEYFVKPDSIVRQIWSDADCILFIFGASSGEFALHKSVDWLFFTGKLPSDPIGRLFSTVVYAQKIIFEEKAKAEKTLQNMKNIHVGVENNRGFQIPNWAYQDVLYMLIHHSISAFELLHRTLTLSEKREIFQVFHEVGIRMGITDLPKNFENWEVKRKENLSENYQKTELSTKLFEAYKTHLGSIRFQLLLYVQKILLPTELKTMARNLPAPNLDIPMYSYKRTKTYWPIHQLKYYLLPKQYRKALKDLVRN